jgi:hypothetical protein
MTLSIWRYGSKKGITSEKEEEEQTVGWFIAKRK